MSEMPGVNNSAIFDTYAVFRYGDSSPNKTIELSNQIAEASQSEITEDRTQQRANLGSLANSLVISSSRSTWIDKANCRNNSDPFYPNENTSSRKARYVYPRAIEAKRICEECAVIVDCAKETVEYDEKAPDPSIRAGHTPEERAKLTKGNFSNKLEGYGLITFAKRIRSRQIETKND